MTESFLWAEKYRPETFDEVVGQQAIVKGVKSLVERGNLPHLLFAGPAGTGKSTIALVIAKTLFGDAWKQNVLELNASDERGIDVVRNKVKDFARTKAFNVPFKIIFLDECDALTREAQQALRRTMENYTNSCRFVLSCNFPTKIIDPIQSRCVKYNFQSLTKDDLSTLVKRISEKEGLIIDDAAVQALLDVSGGDCRRVVNTLQALASSNKTIKKEDVKKVCSENENVLPMITLALQTDFVQARKHLLTMLTSGLSALDVIKLIHHELGSMDLPIKEKLSMIQQCGECEFRLVEGADPFIQLESLLAQFGLLHA